MTAESEKTTIFDYSLEEIAATLREFNPFELAAQFAILGIRGRPKDADHCVLANAVGAIVSSDAFSYRDEDGEMRDDYALQRGEKLMLAEIEQLPLAAKEFVEMFDAGKFPELEYVDGVAYDEP